MTRARLRKILAAGGVRTGRSTDGTVATIIEYVDYWGVMPGCVGSGAELPNILVALKDGGVEWTWGNMPLVAKVAESVQ